MPTVLIVDDSPTEIHVLTTWPEKNGFPTITAESGEEGIQKAKAEKPDAIIMDVVMPGKNGKEVHDRIQMMKPGTRVLFTSGYPSDIIKSKGLVEGEYEFMEKPHSPLRLLNKLREMMECR